MAYGFKLEVWGDFALFSRPELRVERVTYDCITPGAARGILEAILWKPAIRYVVDSIYVMNPIRYTNVRRNELLGKLSARNAKAAMLGGKSPFVYTGNAIAQRASLMLRDVRYIIEAHFEMTDKASEEDNPAKFHEMFTRRASKGQCFSQPYFGCRECSANFRLWEGDEIKPAYANEEKDMGLMLYDMDYSNEGEAIPTFFRAVLRHGILDLRDCEVLR